MEKSELTLSYLANMWFVVGRLWKYLFLTADWAWSQRCWLQVCSWKWFFLLNQQDSLLTYIHISRLVQQYKLCQPSSDCGSIHLEMLTLTRTRYISAEDWAVYHDEWIAALQSPQVEFYFNIHCAYSQEFSIDELDQDKYWCTVRRLNYWSCFCCFWW